MKFTTEKDRICCGGYVFRKGRVVDVTSELGLAAAKAHPDIKAARMVAPAPPSAPEPKKKK